MKTDPASHLGAPKPPANATLAALQPPAQAALGVPEPAAKRALDAANPSPNAFLAAPCAATAVQRGSTANSTSKPFPSTYLDTNLSYLDLSRAISTEKILILETRPASSKPYSHPFAAPNQSAALQSPLSGQPAAPQIPQLSAVKRTNPQLTPLQPQFAIFWRPRSLDPRLSPPGLARPKTICGSGAPSPERRPDSVGKPKTLNPQPLLGRGATPIRLNSTSVRPNSTKFDQIP